MKKATTLAHGIITNRDELMGLVANHTGFFHSIHGSHLYPPNEPVVANESILCSWTIDPASDTRFNIQIQVDTKETVTEDDNSHITHCQITNIRGYICSITLPYPQKSEDLVIIEGLSDADLALILQKHCEDKQRISIASTEKRKFKRYTSYSLAVATARAA